MNQKSLILFLTAVIVVTANRGQSTLYINININIYILCIRAGCPSGWREYRSNCYLLLKNNRRLEECRDECFKHGSDLASILTQEENDFLMRYISERPARDTQIYKVYNIHYTYRVSQKKVD